MQIFADRIEFCWIHLRGIGALENSLWGYDGHGMRVWLNALAIESSLSTQVPQSVKESVNIPLHFYPLCRCPCMSIPQVVLTVIIAALMDKGIIIGAESELIARTNIPFVMFRQATSVRFLPTNDGAVSAYRNIQSHLFLHHVLRYHLESGQVQEAVKLATHYQRLVFFAHALEILLHSVVESENAIEPSHSSPTDGTLPAVVTFLDHFDVALDVVVGCARKTELTRWRYLFDIVGNPKNLFEVCTINEFLMPGTLLTCAI